MQVVNNEKGYYVEKLFRYLIECNISGGIADRLHWFENNKERRVNTRRNSCSMTNIKKQ